MAKIFTISAALTALITISACDSIDYQQTAKDAAAGAAVGAGVNYIATGEVAQGALVGAAAGAGASQLK